ncbi:hypothetical protein AALP_AA3G186900 [Arabis alpina]|uniref:RING-type domain-containing protein n=1 Tax=Arabis alpina TaxID=50452 RepID=A0A087HA47_ARAAL|nr:hypothetical protein AALP_AA3G186900 [Arabis alpina]
MESMDYVIDISSGSDEEVQDDELIRQQDGTVITDEKLIYQAALQDLNQPKTEKDLPLGVLTVPLMRHQKIALEWMRKKEKRSSKNCLGGIVADDQGLEAFYKKISCPISKSSVRGYKKLQAILRAIMLRRTKGTILDGQPIINLPPKIVNLSKVDFSLEEFSFYRKLEAYAQDQFQAYAAEGTVYQNYASILVMLLRLRQACDHPNLVKLAFSCEFWKEPLRKIPRESLYNLLSLLDTSSTICCSVCKDQPKERLIALCGHMFCYDCATEHMNGDQACPVPECGGNLGLDSVFSESILISFFEDDDDYYVDQKPLALRKSKFTSTKIKAVMEVLELLPKQGSPNSLPIKTIVFSQWTGMLDLVEHGFVEKGIESRRLDGTMSLGARDKAVYEFNNDPNVSDDIESLIVTYVEML